MPKKIKIGKSENINASTNIENSEIQGEVLEKMTNLDLSVDEAKDVDASTNVKGTKSQKGLVIVIVAIVAAIVSIAGYYFTKSGKSEVKQEQVIEDTTSVINDSL